MSEQPLVTAHPLAEYPALFPKNVHRNPVEMATSAFLVIIAFVVVIIVVVIFVVVMAIVVIYGHPLCRLGRPV